MRRTVEPIIIPGVHTNKIPHRDFHMPIRKHIRRKWQRRWDDENNHLERIKPTIGPWPPTPHTKWKIETKLARLRIGHTRLTHGYLITKVRFPGCSDCNVGLTFEQIIINCPRCITIMKPC